jgi:thymidylate synthase (FAD)
MNPCIIVDDIGMVELVDTMTMNPEEKIVRTARVSMGGDRVDRSEEQNAKLIRYLASHTHTSPFRHSPITLHVAAPEFIARQWYKHIIGGEYTFKDTGWNEISGRYVQMEDFWIPSEFHRQSESKKQGGTDEVIVDEELNRAYQTAIETSHRVYKQLMAAGVAREEARAVLPLAMMTRFYWTASQQALKHFVNLRSHPDAQSQIRAFAVAVESICKDHYGTSWEVL